MIRNPMIPMGKGRAPAIYTLVCVIVLAVFFIMVLPAYAAAEEKSIEELQEELSSKMESLKVLVTQQTGQKQPDTLRNALTPADVKNEVTKEYEAPPAAATVSIPLAVSAAAGAVLFVVIFRTIQKIRLSIEKDDFIR